MKNGGIQSLVSFTVLALSGCASNDVYAVPTETSYPKDLVTVADHSFSPLPFIAKKQWVTDDETRHSELVNQPLFLWNFQDVENGDDAIQTVSIFSNDRWRDTHAEFRELIPGYGNEACRGDYRVVRSYFYNAGSATNSLSGIQQPGLEVDFRCPVITDAQLRDLDHVLHEETRFEEDRLYFDVLKKTYSLPIAAVQSALELELKSRGFVVRRADQGPGLIMTKTNQKRFGVYGFPQLEKLYAVVRTTDEGSELSFQLHYHVASTVDSSDDSVRVFNLYGYSPGYRNYAYSAATRLLARVEQRLLSEASSNR